MQTEAPYQSKPGPAWAETAKPLGFVPYEPHRVRRTKHTGVKAGPSRLPQEPTGGLSEATADAVPNRTTEEENKAPVSNFHRSRIPHSAD